MVLAFFLPLCWLAVSLLAHKFIDQPIPQESYTYHFATSTSFPVTSVMMLGTRFTLKIQFHSQFLNNIILTIWILEFPFLPLPTRPGAISL